MSLQVLVAHTGERLAVDTVSFASLDDFKSWLAGETSIAVGNQILLTPGGKQVKLQALLVEHEIFLYNRQLISPSGKSSAKPSIPSVSASSVILPDPAPDTLADQNDIQAWRALFKARRDWAFDVVARTAPMAEEAHVHFDAYNNIQRGVAVAVGNLQSHVRTLQQRQSEATSWAEQAYQDQENMTATLQNILSRLGSLPANGDFLKFLPTLNADGKTTGTLEDFADASDVNTAKIVIKQAHQSVFDTVNKLDALVKDVSKDARQLIHDVEKAQTQSMAGDKDAQQLQEEIEVIANKVKSDFEHVESLGNSPKAISQVSKMALLHTRNFLPSLNDHCNEMAEIVRRLVDQRNEAMPKSVDSMQQIAGIEAKYAQVNTQVMAVDLPLDGAEAYDKISLLTQLPFVYGALLIEAVRRREWSDRLKGESAMLAEDIAGYREEEEKRRKKWHKNIGNFVGEDVALGNALYFELNLEAEKQEWPEVSRDDISVFLHALRNIPGQEETIEELSEAAKELDRPTKRQIKRAKGFKTGSIHEGNMAGSFLLRENDELKVLRDLNSKLEEDLKAQKSRVRKLEDLVYKHSQMGRASSGNSFQTLETPPPEAATPDQPRNSPSPTDPSLRKAAPVAARRLSSNSKASDEKTLARRIVMLEAELGEEKQKRAAVEENAKTSRDTESRLRSENEETHSTKRDLMENMEAQQREFSGERKLLKEQADQYKQRVEELEDELDRIVGSRDNEKTLHLERISMVEQELESTKTTLSRLQDTLREKEETQEDQLKTLRVVYANLSPDGAEGNVSQAALINALDELADRAARHTRELSQAVEAAKADKEVFRTQVQKQEKETSEIQSQLQTLEHEAASLRNDKAAENARAASLASDLEDARLQLKTLRAKFAEGETGSESLRQRLDEQAQKASKLQTELAQAKSHVNSLDVELSRTQRKNEELHLEVNTTSKRLDQRSGRDRELTNRLVSYNNELMRLLESLGLSVIRQDGPIAIRRSSKIASSTTLTDPGSSAGDPNAAMSASMIQTANDMAPNPQQLQWMSMDTSEEETEHFNKLLEKIDDFSLSVFSEAIIKLRRDVEWTGKKWKMEARTYRDKYHRAHGEAHEKIAFRAFKEGDLALFLPTRNQATRPWAAFNVGAPHYFLKEQDSHKLQNREWLVARISKVEERVVDLSKTLAGIKGLAADHGEMASADDDNPFELSDGLRWYLLDATEEKAGAPTTPGLGKSTVAAAQVDARGSIGMKKSTSGNDASAKLNKSLESRRNSGNSKRNSVSSKDGALGDAVAALTAEEASLKAPASASPGQLRPTSRSGTPNPGPSGLGIEIARNSEEQTKKMASGSPSKSLLGFLGGSPSRSSTLGQGQQTPQKQAPAGAERTSRPKAPSRTGSKDSRNRSKSPQKQRPQTAWESLFSLEMNLESPKK